MNICFIGAGAFGQALGDIASYNGHSVKFYDPYKFPSVTLSSAVANSEIVVFVAPSETAAETLKLLPKDLPLICASKGFLSVKPFKDFKNFSVLGGAAFAKTLENALGEASAELSSEKSVQKITLTASSPLSEEIFSTEFLNIEYTEDTLGILLCGALKNIYAIGAGFWSKNQDDIEQSSDQTETALTNFVPYLTTAAEEMQAILKANGANPETVKLSCGIPDLLLSCSPDSRNFQYGRGEINSSTIEGLSALSRLSELAIPASCTLLTDIKEKIHESER